MVKNFKWIIDGCDGKELKGWLMDKDFPDSHVQMKVFIDGQFLCNTSANIFRQDLLDAGLGNGEHSFCVSIPDNFFDGMEHVIALGDAVTDFLIPDSTKTILLNKLQQPIISNSIVGCLDSCNGNEITGWAINNANPQEPVNVDIFIDDELISQVIANLFRKDLLDKQENGNCAFKVSIPNKFLDDIKHNVDAYEAETKTILAGSPKTFKFVNKFIGRIDSCDKEGIKGWVANKNILHQPVDIDIFIDDELIATVTANLFRPDLLNAKIGDGNRAFAVPIPAKFWDGVEHKVEAKTEIDNKVFDAKEFIFDFDYDFYTHFYSDLNHLSPIKALNHWQLFGIKEQRYGNCSILFSNQLSDKLDIYLNLIEYRNYIQKKVNWDSLSKKDQTCIIAVCYPLINIEYVKKQIQIEDCSLEKIYNLILTNEVNPHPLFDNTFYREQANLKGIELNIFSLLHYLTIGWKLGLDPHPLFDGNFYVVDIGGMDSVNKKIDPLTAFALSKNDSKKPPSPLIDLFHLRHLMVNDHQYDYSTDIKMLEDALALEWIEFHPHINRTVISFLTNHKDDNTIFEHPNATVFDFCDLIRRIRNGLPYSKKPGLHNATNSSLSVLILNYNKPLYTILSAFSVFNATQHLNNSECLVIDNGSDPFFIELLYRYTKNMPSVKIISLKENRFFGEGNNIGFDYSKGDKILFLNNDAFINAQTVSSLLSVLDNDATLGAVAPVMILPNGQIQEIGGMISGCGHVIQKAKFTPFSAFTQIYRASNIRYCDYVSAAACMLPRVTLEKVLGFDYYFEPFYFEDTDLCARIHAQQLKIGVCLDAYTVHIENVSTKDLLGTSFNKLIEEQRNKFIFRWNGVYEDIQYKETTLISARYSTAQNCRIVTDLDGIISGYSNKPVAWVYTPFDIAIGGGERYIISVAVALSENYETWLLTTRRYSRARLAMVMEDLNIQGHKIHLTTLDNTSNWQRPDVYVCMGNEIEPPTAALGRYNIHHCQFPFPIHYTGRFACQRINHYDAFLVNSQFTQSNIEQAIKKYHLNELPVAIVSPPVSIPSESIQQECFITKFKTKRPITIVNIGRFGQGGHDKRQDIVIQLAEMCAEKKLSINFEIYGGVSNHPSIIDYFNKLCERAKKAKVKIRGNATRKEIITALTNATFYIHTCGLGYYPGLAPEKIEHFGITVVEALSYGTIPLVYKHGGPAEILETVKLGGTFETVYEAMKLIEQEITRSETELQALAKQAMQSSRQFDEQRFIEQINALVKGIN